jgi:molybdopterin synthase catalytic subunit
MRDISNTAERVQFALEQMKKAMPIVKQQVAVYEKNIAQGKDQKKPPIAPQFKNV